MNTIRTLFLWHSWWWSWRHSWIEWSWAGAPSDSHLQWHTSLPLPSGKWQVSWKSLQGLAKLKRNYKSYIPALTTFFLENSYKNLTCTDTRYDSTFLVENVYGKFDRVINQLIVGILKATIVHVLYRNEKWCFSGIAFHILEILFLVKDHAAVTLTK